MLTQYKTQAQKWLVVGFVVMILGNLFQAYYLTTNLASVGLLVSWTGTILFIYGCMLYAQSKGRNKWLGLLGLLSLIGLLILYFVPDVSKSPAKSPAKKK